MVACCGRPSPPCPGTAGTEWRAVEAGCVEARGPSWRSGGGGARPHGRAARGPPLLARTRRVSSLIVTCGGSAERYIFQKNNRVATGTGTARAPPARVAVGTQLVCGYRLVARGGGWRWRGSTDRTTPFGWFRVPSRVSGRRFGPAVGSPAPAGLMRCIPTGQGGGGRISG